MNDLSLGLCSQSPGLDGSYVSQPSYAPRLYPQVIKYMGSKAAILPFIGEGLAKVHHNGKPIVDLFAGACAISGGFGHIDRLISNDIQSYSATIASVYLFRAERLAAFDVVDLARPIVRQKMGELPPDVAYPKECTLAEFNHIERLNRSLIDQAFTSKYHLFTKFYSGTWWSAEQCVWFDSIRQVLDRLLKRGEIDSPDFNLGLTCLMHAMAYTSQGTGHYAQYRDAKDASSMKDIGKYRQASVEAYFSRKMAQLLQWNQSHAVNRGNELRAQDYRDCLASIPPSVVYADPPYAFVHYSRFYHAIETAVRYDYPDLQMKAGKLVKGRYREDRHQSPFCIKTQVKGAFTALFDGVKVSSSDLLLSYSNTGMIGIDDLIDLAHHELGESYTVWVENTDHDHMTMGRKEDRTRAIQESLIIAKKR